MFLLGVAFIVGASADCVWPGSDWFPGFPFVETCAPSGGGGHVRVTTDAPEQKPFAAAPSVRITYSNTNARRYALFPDPLASSPQAGSRPARIAAFQNVTPCGKHGSFDLAVQMIEQAAHANADMLRSLCRGVFRDLYGTSKFVLHGCARSRAQVLLSTERSMEDVARVYISTS